MRRRVGGSPRDDALRIILSTLVLFSVLAGPLAAQRPLLTVVITAEQFRSDYIPRWESSFAPNGLRRMRTEGAYFPLCRYRSLANMAAPNAATLATGAYPAEHGIVADWWYDAIQKRLIGAAGGPVDDSGQPLGPGESPALLHGSTVSDELRLIDGGRAKIVAISDSATPAVMLAGRKPTGCFWMRPNGRFETSPHYGNRLPDWVSEFNDRRSAMRFQGRGWTALDAPPGLKPLRVLDLPGEFDSDSYFALYHASPFAVSETFAFARQAIESEGLGSGPGPDLLWINFSATAHLGLDTGAESPLMRDMVLRLDRDIGQLLEWLDERYGLDKLAIVFTGLHGLPPLPEDARKVGLASARVRGDRLVEVMNNALRAEERIEAHVEKYVHPYVYLGAGRRKISSETRRQLAETAAEAVSEVPGIAGAWALPIRNPATDLEKTVARSHPPGHAGDLVIVYDAFHTEQFGEQRGVSPGSPYRYDGDVPLLLMGRRIRSGVYQNSVEAVSVAATLSSLLGISAPSSAVGRVLDEALFPPTGAQPDLVGPDLPASGR